MAKRPKSLTPKRQAFVDAYTGPAQGNATEAARMAGYAKPGQEGHRLLKNAEVAAAVQKVALEQRSRAIADREERQTFLTSVMRGEVGRIEVEDEEGNVLVESPRARDRIRAAELLGKMQGDFVEQMQVEHSGQVAGQVVFYVPDNGRGPDVDGGG